MDQSQKTGVLPKFYSPVFFFKESTQCRILLWYFHNYEHYIWIVFTPLPSLGSLLLLILFLFWIFPLLLLCPFCVEHNAFSRGCFQKRGWALFTGAWTPYQWKRTLCQPILTACCPQGEVGALRVPSYLRIGCWWANLEMVLCKSSQLLWAPVGHDCVVPRGQHSTATSSPFSSYHSSSWCTLAIEGNEKHVLLMDWWSTLTYSQLFYQLGASDSTADHSKENHPWSNLKQ